MVVPCLRPDCLGFHVAVPKGLEARARVAEVTSGTKGRKAPRYTGPDSLTRAAVLLRDGARCVCCGLSVIGQQYSLQHRGARRMGGTRNSHSSCSCNLITMLGSGNTLCHGRVESKRDPHDKGRGYSLESWQVPALVPVMLFDASGNGATKYLSCDAEYLDVPRGMEAA